MRTLIIGCTGFIGRAIAETAKACGIRTFGIGRTYSKDPNPGLEYIQTDRSNPDDVLRIINDHNISVVIDVIPMVEADTLPLLKALDGEIDQYVMISSADVYSNYELLHKRASGTPILEPANEQSNLRNSRYPYRQSKLREDEDPDRYLDHYDKIPIERAVQELRSAWTILRLPMVYGPGDRQRRFRWAIAPMLEGAATLTLPRVWADWTTTYGYVDNVGAAIVAALGQQRAYREIFNVAEETPVSQLAWAQKFADAIKWQGSIEVNDDPEDPFLTGISNLDLTVPFKIDGGALRRAFGFSDRVSESNALAHTIASEQRL